MNFRELLAEAISHFSSVGYTSEEELRNWTMRLSYALDQEYPGDDETKKWLTIFLEAIYTKDVHRLGLSKKIPKITRYKLDRVAPKLRAELERRVYAGVDLIKLNAEERKRQTLRRFAGWVSSIPPTGSKVGGGTRSVAREISKPTKQTRFESRRVAIDQGHKLSAAVAATVAQGEGAIAAIWHDRGERDHGYDARPKHLERSGQLFLIKDSWAMEQGLIKRGSRTYTDEIEMVAELPFCSCYYEYIVSPAKLPDDCLTARGRLWVRGDGLRNDSVDPNPSPAQIEAGNYRKEHIRYQGLAIALENEEGGIRRGIGSDGLPWEVVMPCDYGYIKGTIGADKEHVDCYVGPYREAPMVWVVEQKDLSTGGFDEHKVMLGFRTRMEALKTYVSGFSDGRGADRIGGLLEMPIDKFRLHCTSGMFAA